jgi:hypothetical protein
VSVNKAAIPNVSRSDEMSQTVVTSSSCGCADCRDVIVSGNGNVETDALLAMKARGLPPM